MIKQLLNTPSMNEYQLTILMLYLYFYILRAIELNPYNAVYYCNRAAAYTRRTQDADAIIDCKEALKLDPTYGKAYGRLGIAYSNLNKYDLALTAYQTALKYDPNNAMYEANLKVAEQMVTSGSGKK